MNPFRGLEFFDSQHAPFFFGRAKAIENVLEVLRQQAAERRPFVLVLGPGASGKTSFVRAGVLPALTQTGTVERDRPWRVVFTRPSGGRTGDPVDALAASLLQGLALPEFPDAANGNGWQELAAELRETPEDAALWLRETLRSLGAQATNGTLSGQDLEAPPAGPRQSGDPPGQTKPAASKVRVALVVDQLEELFQVPSELQRKYIAALGALVKWRTAFVIAALRSDSSAAFEQCCNPGDIAVPDQSEFSARDPNFGEVLAGRFDLPAPSPREIGEMIRSPADATGLRFERDPASGQSLDEALLEAATGVGEPLPLLELLLSQLYQKQLPRKDGLLSWSDYRELGGLEGVLTNHAEGVFSTLDTDAQAALQPIVRQLASAGPGEEAALARRAVLRRDLTSTPEFNEDQRAGAERLIDRFVKEGLFQSETGPNAESLVSVSQQCLLRSWPRARQLLDESRALLCSRDRLEPDFKHWLSGGRKCADLLSTRSGVRDAKTLLKSFRSSLSDTQVDYLQKSLTGQNRRLRIRRAVLAIVAALIIPAVVLGVQWLGANIEQRKGKPRSKELSQKNSERTADPRDALQSRVNDAEAKTRQIQTSLQLATGERDALQNQLKDAEAKAQQARKDAELASSQRDALQNQLNDTQAKAQQAEKDAGLASNQRDTLQAQLNDAQAKTREAQKDAALASSQRDALQVQLNDIQAKAQQAQKDAGLGSSQRDALQAQLNDTQAKAQQAEKDAGLASSQRDALRAQLNDTQAKAQQAEKDAGLGSRQRDALQNQLNDAQAKAQQATKDAALVSSQRDALQAQLNDAQAKAQQATKDAALASSQREALQNQLTQLQQNRAEVPADQREALQAQLKDAGEKVEQARKDAQLASSQRDALQAQLDDAQGKTQQARKDAELASSQRDALQAQLKDAGDKVQQARKDAELASSQRDALQAQLKDAGDKVQQARKDAELASSQRDALHAQLNDAQAKAQQARKDAELAASQRDALQAQLNDTQAKAQQARKDAALASSQRDALQNQLTQLQQSKVERPADQPDTLQAQLKQAQKNAQIAAGQRDVLQVRLTETEALARQIQKNADLAASQRDALQAQLKDSEAKAQQAQAASALASNQHGSTQAQTQTAENEAGTDQQDIDSAADQSSQEPQSAASEPASTPVPPNTQGEHKEATPPNNEARRPAAEPSRAKKAHRTRTHHSRATSSPSFISQVRYGWNRFVQKVREAAP